MKAKISNCRCSQVQDWLHNVLGKKKKEKEKEEEKKEDDSGYPKHKAQQNIITCSSCLSPIARNAHGIRHPQEHPRRKYSAEPCLAASLWPL